jgi:hypothetical protein
MGGDGLWRPWRGVVLPLSQAHELAARCAGLLQVLPPESRFSHATAAALLGLPVAACLDEIHVTVPAGLWTPRRRPGVVTHARVLDEDPAYVDGLPVSCAGQLFLDLACVLSPTELVVLGDAMVRAGHPPDGLTAYLLRHPGQRGVVRARDAVRLIRPGVDSPQETRLRLAIVQAGLPEPEVNPPVYDDAGEWIGSPDLGYKRYRVAGQYEGDAHRTNRRRWRQDIARDESFADAGWVVLRAVADDVARPLRYTERMRRRLLERGWRPDAA